MIWDILAGAGIVFVGVFAVVFAVMTVSMVLPPRQIELPPAPEPQWKSTTTTTIKTTIPNAADLTPEQIDAIFVAHKAQQAKEYGSTL